MLAFSFSENICAWLELIYCGCSTSCGSGVRASCPPNRKVAGLIPGPEGSSKVVVWFHKRWIVTILWRYISVETTEAEMNLLRSYPVTWRPLFNTISQKNNHRFLQGKKEELNTKQPFSTSNIITCTHQSVLNNSQSANWGRSLTDFCTKTTLLTCH